MRRCSHSSLEKMRGPTSMRRGIMLKTATRLQGRPSRVRKPFSLRSLTMAGVGKVLGQQIHHEQEDLVLMWIDFEAFAVVGDAQAVGDVFAEGAIGRGFGVGQLAPPLDGDHLPPGSCALPDHVRAERLGNHITDPLKIRHGSLRKTLQCDG